jgi:DNA-binding NarL/FixJ family response regulator
MRPPLRQTDVRIFLATSREAIVRLFAELSPAVTVAPVAPSVLEEEGDALTTADVAVIDVAIDQSAATELCRELHRADPSLPIAALLCCPHSITPWGLRTLLGDGVSSVLDLQSTPEETLRALETIAHGGSVLHLRLRRGQRAILRDVLTGRGPNEMQLRLLGLVALGLTDQEIARRVHLSPHTVKHHIDQLRREVGTRNRTELAAWAGRHGFYAPGDRHDEDVVPVQLARPRGA